MGFAALYPSCSLAVLLLDRCSIRKKWSVQQLGDALANTSQDFVLSFLETRYRSADTKDQIASEITLWQQDGNHSCVLDDDVLGEHVAITSDAIDDLHQHIQFDPLF